MAVSESVQSMRYYYYYYFNKRKYLIGELLMALEGESITIIVGSMG